MVYPLCYSRQLEGSIIFSHKIQESDQPLLSLNNKTVIQLTIQKHLRMFLDIKLHFQQ